MKWVVLFFCLITTGVSMAQNCVVEGAWMGMGPGAPSQCCQGLELSPPPPGTGGSRGQCLKKENGRFCLGDKLPGLNFPGAVLECCNGLTRVPPRNPDPRVLFLCEKLVCKKEGEWVGVGPHSAQCCEGLVRQVPLNGQIGDAQCVRRLACKKEGEWINFAPGSPACCEGLVSQAPSDGRIGGAECVKKPDTNCLPEGAPLFQYPGAPGCCQGLSAGNPSLHSPVGFAQVCARSNHRPHVNTQEAVKELSTEPSWLTPDPASEVSNQ